MIDGNDRKPPGLSGRAVVFVMVLFGLATTGTLFVYWELYTRPFRPLQNAIAARFPGSSPRVVAGKHKSHLPASPTELRIIVRIHADPRGHESRVRRLANRLADIAADYDDFSRYDQVAIHLMHRRPEDDTISWSLIAPPEAFPLPLTGDLPAGANVVIAAGQEGA